MSELNLGRIRIELIRGGVAPKFIERTIKELDTHYRELKNQAIIDGFSDSDASEKARMAIGNENILVNEVLSKPELKSYLWRFHKSIFVLGPLLTLVASIAVSLLVLISIFVYLPSITEMDPGTDPAFWIKALLEFISFFNFYLMPTLLAVFTIMLAKKRMVQLAWPIAGIVLLVIIGSGWAYSLSWPTEVAEGNMSFNCGYSFLPRAISGDHDLKNYIQILISLSLSFITWRIYQPFSSKSETISY